MNLIDFSSPNGFPLEADATLGFMQSDYQSAIVGVAKYFGDGVIISGMSDNGTSVTDGWIVRGGELLFFQGGPKLSTYVVSDVWVQKANQNGSLLNRYKTRKAAFGSAGTTYNYADLVRLEGLQNLQNRLLDLSLPEPEVVLSGCVVSSVNTGAGTLSISAGVAVINRKFITAPAYSGGYPIYLKEDGSYTNTPPVSNFIKFDPYTSQRWADAVKRQTTPMGEVKMMAVAPSDSFDFTGLGKWDMKGFALCNGSNGTMDLRSRFIVAYDARMSPPGGVPEWDASYATVGSSGGEKTHVLTESEMPAHTHTNGTGAVAAGSYGLVQRSVAGQSVTTEGDDATNSGTEPNILASPVHIPSAGGGQAHENRPPYKVLAFIQRV